MARTDVALLAFNRGLVSRLGLARADIKRLALSAARYVNWMPRVLGSMMLRPGLGYLGSTRGNVAARFIPFVFSVADKALIEFTATNMRVWIDDAVVTRPSVATTVPGGTFPSAASLLANWADDDEAGATSSWVAAAQVGFTGTGTNAARRTATVTVAAADLGVEHALNINISRGPITIRVGSTAGADDYIAETQLGAGHHSLSLTPSGTFYVRFQSRLQRIVYLNNCTIEAAGAMVVPTPWNAATLGNLRTDQSGDIVYVAVGTALEQYKIERRAARSWSAVSYQPEDGPFRVPNVSSTTMTPSVLTGNGTLSASIPFFRSGHLGTLFAVTSTGQDVTKNMTVVNDATTSIEVTGTGTDRSFTIVLSGLSGTGNTVVLQRSFDNSVWTAVTGMSFTADTTQAYTDGLENQTVYYRLICTVYAAGTTIARLTIATGSIRGICRLTNISSSTVADMEVLRAFGGTSSSDDWEEGKWSTYRGFPSSVALYEGRLAWAGKDGVVLSVSDGFESFDPMVEGDSGPIDRSIGRGPVDTINWLLALQRLLLGGQGAEFSCRSTSFDEPLTPSNFNIKTASTQGSAPVPAVQVDSTGIYVQRGGTRVYQLEFNSDTYDYTSDDLSAMIPEIGMPGITRIAVQRQPDTRVHFVRSDGTAAVLLFDRTEKVVCWVEVESDGAGGLIEDVVVLPGSTGNEEDQVYYVVARTISGATVRYLERWAKESECQGAATCKLADSYVVYSGAATRVITGLGHLEGKQVVVWANGVDVGYDSSGNLLYTVAAGQITIAAEATPVVVGLPYTAQWQSGKLVQLAAMLGSKVIKDHKNIKRLGLILADVHRKGLKFGPDFTSANLRDLPSIEGGAPVSDDAVRADLDGDMVPFPGNWTVDSRLCLQAMAPRPCTVLAAFCDVES